MRYPIARRTLNGRSSGLAYATAAAVIVAIGACAKDKISPSGPTPHGGVARLQATQKVRGSSHRRPAEDQIVQLANEIPGFAGYYIDAPNRRLVAYVKDSAQKLPNAAAVLNAHLGKDGFGIPLRQRPRSVSVKQADYDFQTLSDYRDFVADSLLGAPGIVSDGIDHMSNRVTIGVKDAKAQSFVLEQLRLHGIPAAAIKFQVSHAVSLLAAPHRGPSYPNRRRPAPNLKAPPSVGVTRWRTTQLLEDTLPALLAGGLSFYDAQSGKDCTIGAIVDQGSSRRFMSASHCTSGFWEQDSDAVGTEGSYHHHIGYEVADPGATGSACGWGGCWTDRSSDAALFSIDAGFGWSSQKGLIARPNTRSQITSAGASRDTTINSSKPWLYIGGTLTSSSILAGNVIDHIGMRSGWSYGTVTDACADFIYSADYFNGKKVYCEVYSSDMGARAGDSGGPVFVWDGYDGALLVGTLTGGKTQIGTYADSPTTTAEVDGDTYTSNFAGNEFDLGTVDVLDDSSAVAAPVITGSINFLGEPEVDWSPIAGPGIYYDAHEWMWDATMDGYQEEDGLWANITSPYTSVPPWTSYGASDMPPDSCNYDWVGVYITVHYRGAIVDSNILYFRGPKVGSGPAC